MEAKMYNKQIWVTETDPIKLKNKFEKLLIESGFSVLKYCDYFFEPFGYTCLFLLGESHLAIHTFPEENKSYIELSSCVKSFYDIFLFLFEKDIVGD